MTIIYTKMAKQVAPLPSGTYVVAHVERGEQVVVMGVGRTEGVNIPPPPLSAEEESFITVGLAPASPSRVLKHAAHSINQDVNVAARRGWIVSDKVVGKQDVLGRLFKFF